MKKILKIVIPVLLLAGIGVGGYLAYQKYMGGGLDDYPNATKITENGTYADEEILQDVVVTADNVELRNKTIEGTLVIRSDGSHDVMLRNVAIGGDILVENPKEEYTLILSNVTCRNIKIDSPNDIPVNVEVTDSTSLSQVTTNTSITIEEQIDPGSDGVKNLVIESNEKIVEDEEGNKVSDGGHEVNVNLIGSGIETIQAKSPTQVFVDRQSMIENMVANAPARLINEGQVNLLTANADTTYFKEPEQIVTKDGVRVRSQVEVDKDTENSMTTTTTTTTTKVTTTTTEDPATTTTSKTTTTKKTTTQKETTTTTVKTNAPVIVCEDIEVYVGANVNPVSGVTCTDVEDGKIAIKTTHIVTNTVDTTQVGQYKIVYSVTDKDGNTTTKTRKVNVITDPAKIDAPTNVRFSYDNEGQLYVEWDASPQAYDYSVYVNKKQVVKSTTGLKANITTNVNLTKDNTVTIYAAPSPTSALKESAGASKVYKYDPGTFILSTTATVGKPVTGYFDFEPLYVNTRNINRIVVTIEKYYNREYVPAVGVRVGALVTNNEGQATITDYARGEEALNFTFPSSGAYRITMNLVNDSTNDVALQGIIDVYNVDGTISYDERAGVTIDDFSVTYTSYKRWQVNTQFETGMDVNFNNDANTISYALTLTVTDNNNNVLKTFNVALGTYALGYNKKVIYSVSPQNIKLTQSSDEMEEFYNYMVSDEYKDYPIKAQCTITIVANEKTYTATSDVIRFN